MKVCLNCGNTFEDRVSFEKYCTLECSKMYQYLEEMNHPNPWKNGDMVEHVFVMSEYLGTIHHKNGIKSDNRLENLELWNGPHPYGQRVEDILKWCKELLEEYGHTVIMKENKPN
jgi:hypothetical protein